MSPGRVSTREGKSLKRRKRLATATPFKSSRDSCNFTCFHEDAALSPWSPRDTLIAWCPKDALHLAPWEGLLFSARALDSSAPREQTRWRSRATSHLASFVRCSGDAKGSARSLGASDAGPALAVACKSSRKGGRRGQGVLSSGGPKRELLQEGQAVRRGESKSRPLHAVDTEEDLRLPLPGHFVLPAGCPPALESAGECRDKLSRAKAEGTRACGGGGEATASATARRGPSAVGWPARGSMSCEHPNLWWSVEGAGT